ncbi:phage antirepressor KilAC domain-containing protein [Spiractinospora alimapuensis]|uniref:phage antirepressor KilAC domain-containing protein n=1 Tax=Spiractinospora alimapuensis TaxID=2820884 RepID=UPI001F467622|nr:phage antirepressor KilAC domain-containing protein [Spiractinospora alimapuensis]QVQ51291.1 phage antirepressor KilAC domain-containing protein [Spiractinospora alimapuensis]
MTAHDTNMPLKSAGEGSLFEVIKDVDVDVLDLIDHVATSTRIAVRQARNAKAQLTDYQSKAEKYDRYLNSSNLITRESMAKKFGMTQHTFDRILRDNNVLCKDRRLARKGFEHWFAVVHEEIQMGRHSKWVEVLKVTPAGLDGIGDMLTNMGYRTVGEGA